MTDEEIALGMKECKHYSEWNMNLPIQIFKDKENENNYSFTYYMPQRQTCFEGELSLNKEELEIFCHNSATVLRTLADKFEKFARDEIDSVYYPY